MAGHFISNAQELVDFFAWRCHGRDLCDSHVAWHRAEYLENRKDRKLDPVLK
jgi:hypothetical protein